MCEVNEGWKDKNPNYWCCNGCYRLTCDDCEDRTGLTEEEEEDMDMNGYICVCCRKEAKEEDKSK